MGIFVSCCKGTAEETLPQPDAETKRRQLAQAAEKRLEENRNRGLANPDNVRRLERKVEELARLEKEEAMKGNSGGAPLRWQVS